MPKRVQKVFGGENRPIIRRASRSTTKQVEPISLRISTPRHNSMLLSYENEGAERKVDNNYSREDRTQRRNNSKKNDYKSRKRRNSSTTRKPLSDKTNQLSNNHSNSSMKKFPPLIDKRKVARTTTTPVTPLTTVTTRKDYRSKHRQPQRSDSVTPKVDNRQKRDKLGRFHQLKHHESRTKTIDGSYNSSSGNNTKLEKQSSNDSSSSAMDCSSDDSASLSKKKEQSSYEHLTSILKPTPPLDSATIVKGKENQLLEKKIHQREEEPQSKEVSMKRKKFHHENQNSKSENVLKMLLSSCNHGKKDKPSASRHHHSEHRKKTKNSEGQQQENGKDIKAEHKHEEEEEKKSTIDIIGSDVMIHPLVTCCDDESEVTADTALKSKTKAKKSNNASLFRNKSENNQGNDDDYLSINTEHPELPPGWKVKLSRSKNRPYYVHPDHGATWYFPGHAGWKQMYSKTKNQLYYIHPDHGKTWFRPLSFSNMNNNSNDCDKPINTEQKSNDNNNVINTELQHDEEKNNDFSHENEKEVSLHRKSCYKGYPSDVIGTTETLGISGRSPTTIKCNGIQNITKSPYIEKEDTKLRGDIENLDEGKVTHVVGEDCENWVCHQKIRHQEKIHTLEIEKSMEQYQNNELQVKGLETTTELGNEYFLEDEFHSTHLKSSQSTSSPACNDPSSEVIDSTSSQLISGYKDETNSPVKEQIDSFTTCGMGIDEMEISPIETQISDDEGLFFIQTDNDISFEERQSNEYNQELQSDEINVDNENGTCDFDIEKSSQPPHQIESDDYKSKSQAQYSSKKRNDNESCNISWTLKRLSSRVLNPANRLCSLQRLNEINMDKFNKRRKKTKKRRIKTRSQHKY